MMMMMLRPGNTRDKLIKNLVAHSIELAGNFIKQGFHIDAISIWTLVDSFVEQKQIWELLNKMVPQGTLF